VQNPGLDMDLEDFRFRAEVMWMNVRGTRYQAHKRQALLDVLMPHSDVLVHLFNITAATLVNELDKILSKLTGGLSESMEEFDRLRTDTLDAMGELATKDGTGTLDEFREEVFKDPELIARRDKVMGEILGMDLFDVEKVTQLPSALLDELTWSPGQDKDFFAPGPYSGWPLRVWPIAQRPFIRLNDRTYCVDLFGLFDNFYRVIQRMIFRLAPEYKIVWNERQKIVSESLPFFYLTKIMPDAQVYRSVYYRWKTGDGPAQWHEADGLVLFEDHLFVIEVKAGAFTYTSPATDLQAHIASLENLIRNPATQGARFIDYLESAEEVSIADASHVEIVRLRRRDFRHIAICAVTLDAFTELAARVHHLRRVGIDVGKRPAWSISIDDLRVYADIFDNPLLFLDFVEQRIRAGVSPHVDLNDEFDHLGLYIAHNNYSMYAAGLLSGNASKTKLNFNGFRAPIDKYYSAVVHGEAAILPRQKLPLRIAEIIGFLPTSKTHGRAELASYLLGMNMGFREKNL